jgi:hypothetical protein
MASEQVLAPTSTDDLSRAVLSLIAHPRLAAGVYHLVNEGQCSWYEFTCAIVDTLGARVEVVPVDRGGRTGDMRRPVYSVLANTRARALGIALRPWRDALADYLHAKYRRCSRATRAPWRMTLAFSPEVSIPACSACGTGMRPLFDTRDYNRGISPTFHYGRCPELRSGLADQRSG